MNSAAGAVPLTDEAIQFQLMSVFSRLIMVRHTEITCANCSCFFFVANKICLEQKTRSALLVGYQLGCYLRRMKRSLIEASLVIANYRTRPKSAGTCDSAVSWKF